jgi:FtsH-binding integral membrane protein
MDTNLRTASRTYDLAEAQASFMRRVYTWMAGGLLVSALVYYGMMIAQIVAVIALSAAIGRLSAATAAALYIGYAVLTGATLSTIFLVYTQDSIAGVFLSTACGFAGLSLIGYTTRRDLGPIGAFCGMALFGLVGWGLLSIFFPSLMGGSAQSVYSILGVLIFSGLTAYDTQKIKNFSLGVSGYGASAAEAEGKAAVMGALMLYLDFINLFLSLLRLMGDRRR